MVVDKRVRDLTLEKVTDTGESMTMKEGYQAVAADLISMKTRITKLERKTQTNANSLEIMSQRETKVTQENQRLRTEVQKLPKNTMARQDSTLKSEKDEILKAHKI